MKKTLLSMMGVAVTALAFGQASQLPTNPNKVMRADGNAVHTEVSNSPSTSRAANAGNGTAALGAVLFNETFAAGLAGDGSNGAWTTNGKDGTGTADANAVWEYRGPSTTPDVTVGSRGGYVGTRGPITSPTAATGFMIYDSDFLDNAGTAGNFGGGLSPTPHESWLISPSFSTMGSNDVNISFSSYFRRFRGDAYVLLSNDNGVTWGDTVIIMDADFGVNEESATDQTFNVKVNHIANSAQAVIAFYFDGLGDGYYFVSIDDILVAESPDNNLAIGDNYYLTAYDTAWNRYYSQVPSFFSSYDSVQFSAFVSNNGTVMQENVKFNNVVSFNGVMTTTMSSPMGHNMMSGATDSLVADGFFKLDQGIGEYSWAYSVSSDSTDDVPADNTLDTVFVSLTDSTYARDNNAAGNFWYGAGATYEIGTTYDIYDTVKVTSISIAVGSASNAGSAISVYVYDMNSDLSTPLTSTEFIILDPATVGGLVSYKVPEVYLAPGTYLVTYKTYTDDVYFRVSDYDANNGMALSNVDAGGWGWTTSVPVVRLNVSTRRHLCNVDATITQLSDYSIQGAGSNGVGTYTYAWSNSATTDIIANLDCGVYNVTVTDDSACVASASFMLNSPDLAVTAVQDGNNKAVSTATAGVAPYSYLWSDGTTGNEITGAAPGTYSVTVTDDKSCEASVNVDIVTGVIEAGIEGSVSVYPNPNNGDFQLNLENVFAGTYTIAVRNILGQTVYQNVVNVNGNYNGLISISNLESGIYFIDLSNTNGEKSIIKFIVE